MANPTGNKTLFVYSPTAGGTAYDPEDVAAALADSFGIASAAAKKLGCTAQMVREYAQRFPQVRAAQYEGRQRMADRAEIALVRRVDAEEQWAVKTALHAHGADRGYLPDAGWVAVETARAVIEQVGALVAAHVRDRAALLAIYAGINALAGQEVMRVDGDGDGEGDGHSLGGTESEAPAAVDEDRDT